MSTPQAQEIVAQVAPAQPSDVPEVQIPNEARTIVENIYHHVQKDIVTSFKDARITQTTDKMSLFEVRLVSNVKYICIPNNLQELAESNYLYKLLVVALYKADKEYVPLIGKDYKDTMPITKESNLFLNGFGLPIARDCVPNYDPIIKGQFKKGLHCICKYLISTYKNLDPRIFRFARSHHAIQELFGDAWATSRETERKVLDIILNVTKLICKDWHWINSYTLPIEEIVRMYGLKVNKHITPILNEIEQQAIARDFDEYIQGVSNLKVPRFETVDDYKKFQDNLTKLIKLGKRYKNLCKNLIDSRMKLLYTGSKQEKARKKKVPVRDLIQNAKGTKEYLNTFQPNEALRIPKFIVSEYPEKPEKQRELGVQLTTWAHSLVKCEPSRIELCRNWILSESTS